MIMAHKWPAPSFWKKRERSAKKAELNRRKEEKKLSQLLDSHGYAIKIDKDTRKAFKSLQKAKRIDAFTNRGKAFIDSFYTKCIHGRGINGMVSPPDFKVVTDCGYDTLGRYQRAIFRGVYSIEVKRRDSLLEMTATLLHELIHACEDNAHTKQPRLQSIHYPDHGRTFDARLDKLKKILRFEHSKNHAI